MSFLESRLQCVEKLTTKEFPHIFDLVQSLDRSIMFFDTETTGLNVKKAEILEFGYLIFTPDENILFNNVFIKNNYPIPAQVTKIHGLDEEKVQSEGILFTDFFGMINSHFNESIVSGFNSRQYDMKLFESSCQRFGIEFQGSDELDVRDVCIKFNDGNSSGRLIDFVKRFQLPVFDAHEAMSDTIMSAYLLNHLIELRGPQFAADCYRPNTVKKDQQFNLFC